MKRSLIILLTLLLLLTSCQLAQPIEPGIVDGMNGDLMIGFYVTPEYLDLFDFEAWINDNFDEVNFGGETMIEGDTGAYEGRIYATYNEEVERWEFPDLEGHYAFCWERVEDWGISSVMENNGGLDAHFATKTTDQDTENTIDATLYVEPADIVSWYINPVYQDAEGQVYLTAGSGTSFSDRTGGVGMSATQTLTSSKTYTDSEGVTVTDSSVFKVSITTRRAAEEIRVIWMDEEHQVLRQLSFTPDAIPEEFDATDAAYLMVEERNADGTVVYSLAQRDDHDCETVQVYAPGDHGALIRHDIPVAWEEIMQ